MNIKTWKRNTRVNNVQWYNANCLRRQFSHDTDLTWQRYDGNNQPQVNGICCIIMIIDLYVDVDVDVDVDVGAPVDVKGGSDG